MKKLLMLAAVCMAMTGIVHADGRAVPQANGGNPLATADYGGIDITTISFSSANHLLFGGEGGVIYGFHVDSHTTSTDYLIVRSTISVSSAPNAGSDADFNTNKEVFRVYLSTMVQVFGGPFAVGNTTVTQGLGADTYRGFEYWFKYPIRVRNGAAVKLNTSLIRLVTVFYTKFE